MHPAAWPKKVILSFGLALCFSGLALSSYSLPRALSELGWKEKSFSGNSIYSLETSNGKVEIKGYANKSASALYKETDIDLNAFPYLEWQWKISNVYEDINEREKSGDDFPARLYVVYRKGLFIWNTVAINYVWSSEQAQGQTWNSAYTKKSKIVVLQSGDSLAGQWVAEKRNVVEDFKTLFDLDVEGLNGYAIMVDADNSGSTATAWFRDISFSRL